MKGRALIHSRKWEGHDFFRKKSLTYPDPPPPPEKKVPSLRERIHDCHPGRIPYSETVSIVLDVAEGLAYLHQQNLPIVH